MATAREGRRCVVASAILASRLRPAINSTTPNVRCSGDRLVRGSIQIDAHQESDKNKNRLNGQVEHRAQ